MKARVFKQSAGADVIKPFKSNADRAHSGHSSSSCAAVNQRLTHRGSSSTAFGLSCATMPLRSSITRLNRASGFTLLEVMVALAIFATAAMTLTKVAMQYTQSTSNAILRTQAQFVALNEAALMEINQQWLTGTESKQLTQQGETWQIDKRSEPTVSPNVQRIELQVSLVNTETGQAENGISSLMFFNHRMNEAP
ncbi:type II secretion system minor pseudopilin GspI [Acinetobacter variabilis]|uniref:type II secretion system minor pseudopilin GspI n=1 Tax=Acinetobacter variabilis TaxID=70346 RepID=UPI002899CDEF|nr:type II secretion system minor pseudopilin GspI [Acinetobacter variabilis]